MLYILGCYLPDNQRLNKALVSIYGINKITASRISSKIGASYRANVEDLSPNQISKLSNFINDNLIIESGLERVQALSIKRLLLVNCYRGIRHNRRLPLRGQRTRTNSKTIKRVRRRY
jgi:small subunit ribosomal protein S13